jgi:hypothetical protein
MARDNDWRMRNVHKDVVSERISPSTSISNKETPLDKEGKTYMGMWISLTK